MSTEGINKRLYDRRLELDYSVTEACIRLDISKTHLSLIENGYIPVSEKLQKKFIRKYKLDSDFFCNDNLGYSTDLSTIKEEETSGKKRISNLIKSFWFKLITIGLTCSFLAVTLSAYYASNRSFEQPYSFFSQDVNTMHDYTVQNGTLYDPGSARISSIILDSFYALEQMEDKPIEEILQDDTPRFFYKSYNFFSNNEYSNYAFGTCYGIMNIKDVAPETPILLCAYESRVVNNNYRFAFNLYEKDKLDKYAVTILCDYNPTTLTKTYLKINERTVFDTIVPVQPGSYNYYIYTYMFESMIGKYFASLEALFLHYYTDTQVLHATYSRDYFKGVSYKNSYSIACLVWLLTGLCVCIMSLAFLSLSIIKSIGSSHKYQLVEVLTTDAEEDINILDKKKPKEPIPLTRNWKVFPVIPEWLIRLFIIGFSLTSSLAIYFIYKNVISFDVIGVIDTFKARKEITALTGFALILIFFIKLDFLQSRKKALISNLMMFFGGLIFYFVILIINVLLTRSSQLLFQVLSLLIDFIPGNIVWGVLAFNLLASALFTTPDYKGTEKQIKRKVLIQRLSFVLPAAYMVVSTLYSIGKNAWGWNLPLEVSSLFCSKALFISIFAICYCLAIFFYKKYLFKKYDKEDAKKYMTGNRYFFVKNLIVAIIVLIIGIVDLTIGKAWPKNPLGAGGNYVLLYAIPIILLYHPHMGKRNSLWDTTYTTLYGVSIAIGYVLIAFSILGLITSL